LNRAVGGSRDREKWPRHKFKQSVSPFDKAKLAGAVALVIGRWPRFTCWPSRGRLAQWGALLVGWAAAVVCLPRPSRQGVVAFGRDATREVKKVVWPSRKEAIQMTAYVFGFVAWSWPCFCG
jgi:preprotein translocase subunit SecE